MFPEWLTALFTREGGFFVLIVGLLWGAFRFARWTGNNIVLPIRDRGLAHLDTVDNSMKQQTESLASLGQMFTTVTQKEKEQCEVLRKIDASLSEHGGCLRRIEEKQDALNQKLSGEHTTTIPAP